MQVIINHDNHIDLAAATLDSLAEDVSDSLKNVSDRVTRVEVHLKDQNSSSKNSPDDIRCLIEARVRGKQPISAEARGDNVNHALTAACDSIERRLSSILDKDRTQRRHSQRDAKHHE